MIEDLESTDEETTQEVNTLRTEAGEAAAFIAQLALAFRQLVLSCVVGRPRYHVRNLTLQRLELYVHNSRVYQETPVKGRWIDMCKCFGWNEDWDKDDEIPSIVKHIDKEANAIRLRDIDLRLDDEDVEQGREELKQLPENHWAHQLLKLWDKLPTLRTELELHSSPCEECN